MKTAQEMIVSAIRSFLKEIHYEYGQFLDEHSKKWSQSVYKNSTKKLEEDNVTDSALTSRRQLLNEITKFTSLYIRRDIKLLEAQTKEQMQRIERLEELRRQEGEYELHPTILAARAHLHATKWEFEDAADYLQQAIDRGKSELYEDKIPVVVNQMNLTRCLYKKKDYRQSLLTSDECLSYSLSLDKERDSVSEIHKKFAVDPMTYCPPAVYGYFSVCDARIHNPNWSPGTALDAEFNSAWDDSHRFYEAPKSWLPYMKIMVVSDHLWATKLSKRTEDVAKSLYVDLGTSWTKKQLRFARANYGKFMIDFSALGRAACIPIIIGCIAFYSDTAHSSVSDILHPDFISQALTRAKVNDPSIEVAQMSKAISAQIPKSEMNEEGFALWDKSSESQDEQNQAEQNFLFTWSGGEQTTERI